MQLALIGATASPANQAPNRISKYSGRLDTKTPTREPGAKPLLRKAWPSAALRCRSCA